MKRDANIFEQFFWPLILKFMFLTLVVAYYILEESWKNTELNNRIKWKFNTEPNNEK